MPPSTQRNASMLDHPVPEVRRGPARVTRLRTVPPGNDARQGASLIGGEAWPWHMVPPIAPSRADANEAGSAFWPTYRLYQAAQRRRAILLGDWFAAALRTARAAAHRLYRGYRQFRRAQETYRVLDQLDDRTLRDLGFTRDEIRSVAVEMASQAEPTRRLARPTFPPRPSLFGLLFGE